MTEWKRNISMKNNFIVSPLVQRSHLLCRGTHAYTLRETS